MRRPYFILLGFLFSMVCMPISAYDFMVDGVCYSWSTDRTVDGMGLVVTYRNTDYNSYQGSVTIPSALTVQQLADAGVDVSTITSEKVSVVGIGERAFCECLQLDTVLLPDLLFVDDYAFAGCAALKSIKVSAMAFWDDSPETAQSQASIGNHAFENCSSLQTVRITGFSSIGDSAFAACGALASLHFFADHNNRYLTGGGPCHIGKDAFRDCVALNQVDIDTEVMGIFIHERAFSGCSSLQTLDFFRVFSIGNHAFENCTRLEAFSATDLYLLGDSVFFDCSNLRTFENDYSSPPGIADVRRHDDFDVNELYDGGFKTRYLDLGRHVFEHCHDLSVTLRSEDPSVPLSEATEIFYGCDDLSLLIDGYTIPDESFSGCLSLAKLMLDTPEVGELAFLDCTNLKWVEICRDDIVVADNAFRGVGTRTSPSTLVVPEGFDLGVSTEGTYVWKEGIFGVFVSLLGDVNHDGLINMSDVTRVISYILGNNPQPFYFNEADINHDELINMLDVTSIINIILKGHPDENNNSDQ